jgi:hypothetical protein
VLGLETLSQRIRDLLFVLNDQNAHAVLRLESRFRIGIIDAVFRRRSFLTKISGTLQWWGSERRARSAQQTRCFAGPRSGSSVPLLKGNDLPTIFNRWGGSIISQGRKTR